MNTADREMLLNVLAGSAAVLAFVGFVVIGKLYHGYYGLTLEDLLPLAYLLLSWLVFSCMRFVGWTALETCVKAWMWLSLLVALALRYGAVALHAWGSGAVFSVAVVILALGFWVSREGSTQLWAGYRRVVALVPSLIVVTPLVLVGLIDEPLVWLDAKDEQPKTATVILLFDEMNARDSQGMQKVLRDHGLQVNFRPVKPVHGSTTEVIPAIFTGLDFQGAHVCGLTRVCSDVTALNFANLYVQRNDVDIVGFHHPYCSIKGLRYCYRASTLRNFFDVDLMICGIKRLIHENQRVDDFCHKLWHQSWFQMRVDIEKKIFDSPSIHQGGFLYAHIPLPHPPALITGTLKEQYQINLDESENIVKKLMVNLDSNNLNIKVLIFSDHPLRQALWCKRARKHFDAPCVVTPELVDDHVPLIVAGRSRLPTLENVKSNQQVFEVLREWSQY